ncbi:MAG TPA: hypothetical protein VF039_06650 [Longimicrobiales bacterium]
MSDDARGTALGFGPALVEQLRWFWQRLWLWIVISAVLVAGAAVWIIASIPDEESPIAYVLLGSAFHPLLVLIALSWALSAWRDDPPKDRQYFWLHPVQRDMHAIARTLAGLLWLLLVVLVVLATVFVASRGMVPADMAADAGRMWLFAFASIALTYVAASIAAVLSDRPLIWILLIIAIVILAGVVAGIREIAWLEEVVSWLTGGPRSFGTAIGAPGAEAMRLTMESMPPGSPAPPAWEDAASARPGAALAIWWPITVAAYLGAVRLSRPR